MLQRILLTIAFVLAMFALPGCLSIPAGDKIGVEDVVVKNISAAEGITVSVRGTDCHFSFTADRANIYSELQKCVLGDETSTGLLLATAEKMGPAPIPNAQIEAIHQLHQKEKDVDKATELVLAKVEPLVEEVPVTPQ